jgi:hypothetical protein
MFLSVFTAAQAPEATKMDQAANPDIDLIGKQILTLPDFNFQAVQTERCLVSSQAPQTSASVAPTRLKWPILESTARRQVEIGAEVSDAIPATPSVALGALSQVRTQLAVNYLLFSEKIERGGFPVWIFRPGNPHSGRPTSGFCGQRHISATTFSKT